MSSPNSLALLFLFVQGTSLEVNGSEFIPHFQQGLFSFLLKKKKKNPMNYALYIRRNETHFFSMMMFKPSSLNETLMVIHKLPYKHISHILCNWFLSYNIYNAQIQIPSLHSRVNSVTQKMVQTNGRDGSRDRSRKPDLGIGAP